MTHTLVSYNRPFTRSARRALEEYGIESVEPVEEPNRWAVVEVEELPPRQVLEAHELRHEREPDRVFLTPDGKTASIYRDPDLVVTDGVEATLSPEEAIEHAENQGWEEL